MLHRSNDLSKHRFVSALTPPWSIKREFIYRETPYTDERYGCIPDKRPIDKLLEYGLIILDKPSGPTSHDVTALIKRIVEARKAGHGGTLEA